MKDINVMEEKTETTPNEVPAEKENINIEELLFPPLPDDYFKNNNGIQFNDNNPIENAIDAYNNVKIKPYIKHKTLGGDGDPLDDAAKKSAWEIGLHFSF